MADGISEDLTICNKACTIIERKLSYDNTKKKWHWTSPKTIRYRKLLDNKHFDIIKQLVSSSDLKTTINAIPSGSETNDDKTDKVDSGISSMTSFSDMSVKTDVPFWEPTKLKIGDTYLVCCKPNRWQKAKLIQIGDKGALYAVDLITWKPLTTTFKHIAHPEPLDCLFKVGTRVVVYFAPMQSTGEIRGGKRIYRLAVVAEYPTPANKHRYLVIFDEGSWLYVQSSEVFPVYTQPKKIYDILPEEAQKIVRDFLKGQYREMTECRRGDTVKYTTERGASCGNIICVDASLVLVWLYTRECGMWIHRGSSSLVKV